METTMALDAARLPGLDIEDLLAKASQARVAVCGDFCLDAYWTLDPGEPEISIETGLPTQRVTAQRYGAGGAGNVAANLAALGAAKVSAIGFVGADPFGPCLAGILEGAGVDCKWLMHGPGSWQTCVYSKPLKDGIEGPRTDFGAFNAVDGVAVRTIAKALEMAAEEHDAIIINRQLANPLVGRELAEVVNRLAADHPGLLVLVDARHGAGDFCGAVLKLNNDEAFRLASQGDMGEEARMAASDGDVFRLASALSRRNGKPAFVTRGAKGVAVAAGDRIAEIKGIEVPPPIDTVGAGDCLASALAATLSGFPTGDFDGAVKAARFANLAASVILKKLNETGTATPDEIRAAARQAAGESPS